MKKSISIVTPIFSESKSLLIYWNEIQSIVNNLDCYEWIFVFVNDGSTDDSFDILINISKQDDRIKVIDFTRNFGKEAALAAGVLASINSDAVITIDADLQHPPNLIPQMLDKWESGSEIVIALRFENIGQSWFRKLGSIVFSLVMKSLSQTPFVNGNTDFRLYDRQVVEEFSMFRERIKIFRGLIDWMGFKADYVYFQAPKRLYGKSVYTKSKLIKLAIDAITTFSLWPLKIVGLIGILITLLSLCLLVVMVYNYLYSDAIIYTPLAIFIVANTFLIGLVLSMIGLVALYIGNIQTEVLARPPYIIRKQKSKIAK